MTLFFNEKNEKVRFQNGQMATAAVTFASQQQTAVALHLDFSHHIGAAVQLLTPACQYLKEEKNRGRDIQDIFTQVRETKKGTSPFYLS